MTISFPRALSHIRQLDKSSLLGRYNEIDVKETIVTTSSPNRPVPRVSLFILSPLHSYSIELICLDAYWQDETVQPHEYGATSTKYDWQIEPTATMRLGSIANPILDYAVVRANELTNKEKYRYAEYDGKYACAFHQVGGKWCPAHIGYAPDDVYLQMKGQIL